MIRADRAVLPAPFTDEILATRACGFAEALDEGLGGVMGH
jgi:hypothetical protein